MSKLRIKTDLHIRNLRKSAGYDKDERFSVETAVNLYLFYYPKHERKSFYFRYVSPINHTRQNLKLGEYPSLTLANATKKAIELNQQVREGRDPKREQEQQRQAEQARLHNTFFHLAEHYFNGIYKHKAQNLATRTLNWQRLERHILPHIGKLPITDINVAFVNTLRQYFVTKTNERVS